MKFFNGLIKWVVVILAGLSAALLAIIFLSKNPGFNQFLLRLAVLAAVGFFSGLAARILFSRVFAIFSILLVWIAGLLSILLIDQFYATSYQLDFIKSGFDFSAISISDGGQILFICLVSLLPLFFMRRKQKKTASAPARKPKRSRNSISDSLKPVLYRINPQNWQIFVHKPASTSRKTQSTSLLKTSVRKKTTAKPKATKTTKPASAVTVSRPAGSSKPVTRIKSNGHKPAKVKSNGRKPTRIKPAARKLKLPAPFSAGNGGDVKLVGEEEHVCPYCLEEVVSGDERGIVICPECGTWHHQDCWNLTGSCGVAHRNEL